MNVKNVTQRILFIVLHLGIQLFSFWITRYITINTYLQVFSYAALSALIATLLHRAWWWIALHGSLPLLGYLLLSFDIPSYVYLILFLILIIFFGTGSLRRAPLFLSGHSAWEKVAEFIPTEAHVLDAGCGFAGLLHYLFMHRPDLKLAGSDLAWMPYLISYFRSYNTSIQIYHKDLWQLNWANYDVIFVFLSPDPMQKVWEKFQAEMKPESWLISYHFSIDNHPPSFTMMTKENHSIYCWKR
ncbi:MAG: hypothetical protein V4525_07605 [Pseudomonadota bacterium]